MLLDDITVFVCVLLLLLMVWSLLSDTFFAKVDVCGGDGDAGKPCGPVSVIIVSDNNAAELAANLPVYLSQDYQSGYEVIVVVDRDEDGTSDVLKTFADNPLLYTTFVPDSSRYMNRRKLAITLGVKAAKNECILLADATARPASSHWIERMSSACREGVGMVLGYSDFAEGTGCFKRFYRFHRTYSLFHEAQSGQAYSLLGCNLMFRKSMFMAGNGFLGNLKYLRGEFEFMVNKYSDVAGVSIETSRDSYIVENVPSLKKWHDMNVFHVETRRHLANGFRHRAAFVSDMLSLHVCMLVSVVMAVWSAIVSRWVILPVAVLVFIVPLLSRTLTAKRAIKSFGVHVPLWRVVPMEIHLVWHNIKYVFLHKFSDKYDFISHKS